MTIEFRVLGEPGRDNAVYLTSDTGQSMTRMLFDCGGGCIENLSVGEAQLINAVFFSHYHIDHVAGFDSLFRHNYNREQDSFLLVGPVETHRVLENRLRGFTWNLVDAAVGSVEVREFDQARLRTRKYRTRDQFEAPHDATEIAFDGSVYKDRNVTVCAIELDHGCVSAGYHVQEHDRLNVEIEEIEQRGLLPGPWIQDLKSEDSSEWIEVQEQRFRREDLRRQLVHETKGQSFAYLTDFRIDESAREQLISFIKNVDVLVCENSYRDEDAALAKRNFHMTSTDVGRLAHDANVGELVLFHVSARYPRESWQQHLAEVRALFPKARWPENW